MKDKRKKQVAWEQRPGEPNPQYVAFVLYLCLGPKRNRIIREGAGKDLWQMLLTGLEGMNDDAPLPLVCYVMSSTLKNIMKEDALEQIGKDSPHLPFMTSFHEKLQADEQLLAAMEEMLSALEKVKRGESLPRSPVKSGSEVVRDVDRFLKKREKAAVIRPRHR